jgi:hypothetical protein
VWDWAIWSALILAAVAGAAAAVLVAMRTREAWRAVRDVHAAVVGGLDRLAASGEATADKLARAGDTAELQQSLARLRVSLARLAVLRAAIGEADDTFGSITAVLPRT